MADAGLSNWFAGLPAMAADLQFLRPWWLCGVPVIVLWVWLMVSQNSYAGWAGAIDKKKLKHLRSGVAGSGLIFLCAAVLTVVTLALAGPSMSSLPGKTGHANQARVFVLDLSPSMLARDIKPDRLSVAKLKLIDLLRLQADWQSGLVVYAANAHQVSPLIDDPRIIESLVPVLHPDIMPTRGSNAEQAIAIATTIISDGGFTKGDIVLITDGLHADAISAIRAVWKKSLRLSILAVGTEQGAPFPDGGSQSGSTGVSYALDKDKNPIVARLDIARLEQLAKDTGGRFAELTADSTDINTLNNISKFRNQGDITQGNAVFDEFQDAGYWLALLVLPFVLIGFRKNMLWVMFPLFFVAPDSYAFDWNDLWFTKDQQAQHALARGDLESASVLFTDPRWKAVSHYQLEQYTEAVTLLGSPEYADDLFNRGNAQALAGDMEGALVSYQIALQLYGTEQDKNDTVNNIQLIRHLISREEQDQSNANGSGAASDALQNSDGSDAQSDTEADGAQAPIGGAAGGLDTLQQQALAEQSASDTADRDIDNGTAGDANTAPANTAPGTADLEPPEVGANDTDTMAAAEQNSNLVLSPYSEQWLREIPEDPGGYLRRKFGYQSQTRQSDEKAAKNVINEDRY